MLRDSSTTLRALLGANGAADASVWHTFSLNLFSFRPQESLMLQLHVSRLASCPSHATIARFRVVSRALSLGGQLWFEPQPRVPTSPRRSWSGATGCQPVTGTTAQT